MPDRRTFSFGALAVALSPPALADAKVGPSVTLRPTVKTSRDKDVLKVVLSLTNEGASAIEFLARTGASPGPQLTARILDQGDEVELVRLMDAQSRKDLMSRMGPRPSYRPMAVNQTVEVGTYAYTLPRDITAQILHLQGQVWTDLQQVSFQLRLPLTGGNS